MLIQIKSFKSIQIQIKHQQKLSFLIISTIIYKWDWKLTIIKIGNHNKASNLRFTLSLMLFFLNRVGFVSFHTYSLILSYYINLFKRLEWVGCFDFLIQSENASNLIMIGASVRSNK